MAVTPDRGWAQLRLNTSELCITNAALPGTWSGWILPFNSQGKASRWYRREDCAL